ncbi:phage tail protein [Imbroritus primus]|uniref:phage tail protein n=1 Tax=Imbroritus primus TaxID=3058603 RepID=UPI003D161CF5
MFYAPPIREVRTEEEVGGKGGPTQTNVTYAYFGTFAISLSDNEISGVRRIWADGKLVYDVSDTADSAAQAASSLFANYMQVYTGTETQMPDPTMESDLGAGNVPAYRGTAYVVFTDLPLANYGNRLPQMQFEVTNGESSNTGDEALMPQSVGNWSLAGVGPVHADGKITTYWVGDVAYSSLSAALLALQAKVAAEEPQYGVPEYFLGWSTGTNPVPNVFEGGATVADNPQFVYYHYASATPEVLSNDPTPGDFLYCSVLSDAGATVSDGKVYWFKLYPNELFQLRPNEATGNPYPEGFVFSNSCTNYPDAGGYFPVALHTKVHSIKVERTPSCSQTCAVGDPRDIGIAQLPDNPSFCISRDGVISFNARGDVEAGSFLQLTDLIYEDGVLLTNALGPVLRSTDPLNTSGYWTAAAAAAGVPGTYPVDFPIAKSTACVDYLSADSLARGTVYLSDIVKDVCERAGMVASQFDVSELTDVVDGYVVARQMAARGAIEPLQRAYYFDAIESGGKIKFRKRGRLPVIDIEADDLGASDNEKPTTLVSTTRTQEAELPARINVAYMAKDADYQTGAQSALRMTCESQQVIGVELPLVLSDQKAAEVANVLMYTGWASRSQRTFSTTRKYAFYEPTDVVRLPRDGMLTPVRLVEKTEAGGRIDWVAEDDGPSVYAPNVTAAPVAGGQLIRFDGPTMVELMDIPMLVDDTNDPGFYAAAGGYRPEWRGGQLFRSADDGATWSAVEIFNTPATIGYALDVLGTFAGQNTVDELNSVQVTLYRGELTSVTREQMLAGANTALLGDELIQFRTASLVSGLTYRLSGLLRARRGTEQHMGTHAINERFVLLSPTTTHRIAQLSSQIGQPAAYKAVTLGQPLSSAMQDDFTNTAAGLKPLAPLRLAVIPLGDGTHRARWERRTRFSAEWRDGVDAPLGEAIERYEVEVRSGEDVLRVLAVAAPSPGEWPSVDLAGLAAGNTVTVYQMSEIVGRGFPATFTV